MGMQDEDISSGTSTFTNYGLGARGIERIEKSGEVSYPIYDGHGSMVAMLAASGGQLTLRSQRSYGAWGDVRNGAGSGDPKGRYCASLGHRVDDESGLTYMGGRCQEPLTGRFLSEDNGRQGRNYYVYCGDEPIGRRDRDGKYWDIDFLLEKAWDIFNKAKVFGSGCIDTVNKLEKVQESLMEDVEFYKRQGQALLSDSEVEAASAPYMGATGGELQARIAELKADLAGKANVQAVVAQLSAGLIDVMIFMVQNDDPERIFG
jgi:RHS repeat-associated protein